MALASARGGEKIRCTYCAEWCSPGEFGDDGEHVIPASLGGAWVDPRVCQACNRRANAVADELVGKDFLMRYMRARYRVPDRYGKVPKPPVFAIRLSGGGVVNATLSEEGPRFKAGLPASVAERLALSDPDDQALLARIAEQALDAANGSNGQIDSLELAKAARTRATPSDVWSRFMSKLGLACGREAYGEDWLDSRQARALRRDLLGAQPPRFMQREVHPPVAESWPFRPPAHLLWIEPYAQTAVLMVALFAQVIGAVPVNDLPADGDPTAWVLDPLARSHYRSSSHAVWLASAARRIQDKGGTPVMIADKDRPFIYVPDGPEGPIDFGTQMVHVDSIKDALEAVAKHYDERDAPRA
jgi:hypothetical protein